MNLPTIIVGAVLLVIIGAIVYKMVKDKKNGKSSCGCDCGSCGCNCHSNTAQK